MNKKLKIMALLFFILALSACGKKPREILEEKPIKRETKGQIEEVEKVEKVDIIKEQLEKMSLEEKVGQLFIFGFDNDEIESTVLNLVQEHYIGGFIFFKKNISTLEEGLYNLNTLKEMNKDNPIPLFLAVDEEGGRVSRMPRDFLKLPSPKKIGDIDNEDISFEYGRILGNRLGSLGFNMDFAPVLDVNSNPKNPVIGDRSFGSTVEPVVDNGLMAMKGIQSKNIISVVKHFPGHGDTKIDSHVDLPIVDKNMEELETLELTPFKKAIEANADSIMIGHILFPKIDEKNPATFSKNIINDVLREEVSFDGLIISDDMTMGAIMENYNVEDAVVEFFKAGGDIALVCYEKDIQLNLPRRIIEEIKSGNISEAEIDTKVYRILKIKEKYNISDKIIDNISIDSINEETENFLKQIKNYN